MKDPDRVCETSTDGSAFLQYHPDKHSEDLSGAEKAKALEVFHRITKAYHLLTDPKLRQEFDTKSNGEDHHYIISF